MTAPDTDCPLRMNHGKIKDAQGRTYSLTPQTKVNVSLVLMASGVATLLAIALRVGAVLERLDTYGAQLSAHSEQIAIMRDTQAKLVQLVDHLADAHK